MKFSQTPYHPILLSIYPIAHLYAQNIVYIPLADTFRPLTLAIGFTVCILLGFRLILRDWARAGALCSAVLLLFYSFGHVANAVDEWCLPAALAPNVVHFRALWLVAFLVIAFFVVRWQMPERVTLSLNLAGVILAVFPLATILSYVVAYNTNDPAQLALLAQVRGEAEAEAPIAAAPSSRMPDIYYVVFDGYERSDLLYELHGCDNSSFLAALVERGFYIASSSRSNYLSTNYSLNTSLNLVYYDDMPERLLRSARYSLRINYVSGFLRERGYQIVVFDSGSRDTNNQYSDLFVSPRAPQSEGTDDPTPFE